MKEYIVQAFDFQETIDLDPFRAEDVPELIRCRDCKHGELGKNKVGLIGVMCRNPFCGECEWIHTPYWFCADGRRRDE